MKIIKAFKFLALFIALLLALQVPSKAANGQDWFFKRSTSGGQPTVFGGSDMPKQYGALYMGKEGDKTLYLTFDAGYGNESVEKTLDILAKHNIKGAFFILPGIIKNSPETVKRMASDGHLICNHSTSHGDMSKIENINDFRAELLGVEKLYKNLTGKEMEKYFRPPRGTFSEQTLEFCKKLGYTPVFWSFAYADWDDKLCNPSDAKKNFINSMHDGAVILLHPTSRTNAEILDEVIAELKQKGYSFGTLDELKEKNAA